jgi:cyclic pyranopterin phosphate synthase
MRLTADGKLRACLFSKDEVDLKDAIRSGASLAELASIFKQATTAKPQGHRLDQTNEQTVIDRAMRAIGG